MFKNLRHFVEFENNKWRCCQMTEQNKKKKKENQEKKETEYKVFLRFVIPHEFVKD